MGGRDVIDRDGGPARAGALEAAESALGLQLPDEYCAFLAEHDGARLDDNRLEPGRAPSGGADSLYGSAELAERQGWARDRMPPELLPIGDAGGGDRIALGVDGDRRGRVYLWEHEFEADEGPPHWDNVTELAPSFRSWFDALVPMTDDDLPDVEVTGSIKRGFLSRMRREGRL